MVATSDAVAVVGDSSAYAGEARVVMTPAPMADNVMASRAIGKTRDLP